ncbi:MAG: hypothetical protein IIZ93_14690 [Acidaminococcaceae bacterium]|nr:hypothetical protein [Acidaminococcaceae bacterium]
MRLIDADAIPWIDLNGDNQHNIKLLITFADKVNKMPTIEERKRGKWIEDAETYYKAVNEKGGGVNENTPYFTDDIGCPECLSLFSVINNETERFDFCPRCGADLRGEQDERPD